MNRSTDTDAAPTADDKPHYNAILAVLAVAGTTFAMLQSLVIPALPDLQHALHTSESGVAWILTAYLLSASVLTPILGRVGDMIGKERVPGCSCRGTAADPAACSVPAMQPPTKLVERVYFSTSVKVWDSPPSLTT